jgi:pimeloyl-ACP methyl ester carboxylesterase
MKNNFSFLATLAMLLISCSSGTGNNNRNMATANNNKTGFDSGYCNVHGLRMYYEIYGKGEPVVLIHGGGSTIQTSFGRIIPALSKNRKIIAMELQGHGRTCDVDRPESFDQDADDVASLLDSLKIGKADFFGFSNGGNTTMRIAMRYPALVNKIILGSAFFKREGMQPKFWKSMQHATLENMPQELKDAYKQVAPDSSGLIRMFSKDKQRMIEFSDWKEEDLRSIKAPALIISGDADVVRPEHAVEMFRLIPNCELTILPGGHGKYMGEITTLSSDQTEHLFCVPLIEEFLAKQTKPK